MLKVSSTLKAVTDGVGRMTSYTSVRREIDMAVYEVQ